MAASMKEYVRRQLVRWVDDFQDEMLPRDFAKPHTRAQLAFPQIHLKPHRVAELLRLRPPLLITRAFCAELTLTVPSWTDKGPQKPMLIRIMELHIDVKNAHECRSKVRHAAEERARAALPEPDPLGSIAAAHALTSEINECLQLAVDAICIQMFIGGIPRLQFVLENFHARPTDALWQDLSDTSETADCSPDNLTRTRFKCVSFALSVSLSDSSCVADKAVALLDEVPIVARMTLLCHRSSIDDVWGRDMQLVNVDVGLLQLAVNPAELFTLYTVSSTLWSWFMIHGDHESGSSAAMTFPKKARKSAGLGELSDAVLQITLRGGLEAMLTFASPSQGQHELFFTVERVVVNTMEYSSGKHELQLSVNRLAVVLKEHLLLQLKPDREVLSLELRDDLVLVKWRLDVLSCAIDDEQAAILTEVLDFFGEQKQAAAIKCGTCRQQIHLEMIDSHICRVPSSGSLPSSPTRAQPACTDSRRNSISEFSSLEVSDHESMPTNHQDGSVPGPRKVSVVFRMNTFELQIGSQLAKLLLPMGVAPDFEWPTDFDGKVLLTELRVSTESSEFLGDSVFVPIIPLAFQMLECTLRGCECISKPRQGFSADERKFLPLGLQSNTRAPRYRWPSQFFVYIGKCSVTIQSPSVTMNLSLTADTIRVYTFFSDGSRVCISSHPQLSFHIGVDQVCCELTESCIEFVDHQLANTEQSSLIDAGSTAPTFFLGALHIKTMEITVQEAVVKSTPTKKLLQEIEVVFDNELGFLSTQSSLNVQMTMNYPRFRCEWRQVPTVDTPPRSQAENCVGLSLDADDILDKPSTEVEYEHAGRYIQRGSVKIRDPDESIVGTDGSERDYSPASSIRSLPCIQGVLNPVRGTALAEDFDHMKPAASILREEFSDLVLPDHCKPNSSGMEGIVQALEAPASVLVPTSHSLPADFTAEGIDKSEVYSANTPKSQEICSVEIDEIPVQEVAALSPPNDTDNETVAEPTLSALTFDTKASGTELPKENPPDAKWPAGLPDVVRVLVQVRECRLCIPISRHASVKYVCCEVVRRFNESFGAERGEISSVSLQDKHGGVLSPSDSMHLVLTVAPCELFFAYPHGGSDGKIRSVARVTAGVAKFAQLGRYNTGGSPLVHGEKPTKFSKIPLPLAIALLANASQRDLTLSRDCSAGADGMGSEQWPDLAITASFLDYRKKPLLVEVIWHDTHMAMTNVDALALCLQQLGLQASHGIAKRVGNILRDRLKVNSGCPLTACTFRRKKLGEYSAEGLACVDDRHRQNVGETADSSSKPPQLAEHEKETPASSQGLKEAVQDVFGIYSR